MKLNQIFILFIVGLSCNIVSAQETNKPNIIVIMTDNQGYGDLGIYGGLRAPTPRIDKLAKGVHF